MKKLILFILVFTLGFLFCSVTFAQVKIDFENKGLIEGQFITTEIEGLTFTNTMIAEEGSPRVAFSGSPNFQVHDTVLFGGPFGGFFITDPMVGGDYGVAGKIEITFEHAVSNLSFQVADIDAGTNWTEIFTSQTFDASEAPLETIRITGGTQGTGSATATLVQFGTDNISRLTITVTDQFGRSGWGIDNLKFTSTVGVVKPDDPYDSSDNSRTLVNGTCWKFIAERYDANPVSGVKWWIEPSNRGLLFDESNQDWKDTAITTGDEVWFKAGNPTTVIQNLDCEVHAELIGSGERFDPARVKVKVIPGLKQKKYPDFLGFWKKEQIPQSDTIKFYPRTIKNSGCKLTSLAMLSWLYGANYLPPTLNDALKNLRYTSGEPLGYYIGQYLFYDGEPLTDPPYTLWIQDFRLSSLILDANNVDGGLQGTQTPDDITPNDAAINPAFHAALLTPDDWPVYVASNQKLRYVKKSEVNIFNDVLKSLRDKDPIPVLLEVNYNPANNEPPIPRQHFVLAVGLSYPPLPGIGSDIMILNPSGPNDQPYPFSENFDPNNKTQNQGSHYVIKSARIYMEVPQGYTPSNAFGVHLSCNAQLLMRDSQGRKAGVLATGEFIDEIGGTNYEVEDPEGIQASYDSTLFTADGHKSLSLYLDTPEHYEISVIGTGYGSYFINTTLTDTSGESHLYQFPGGMVDEGVNWIYTCYLDPLSGVISGELIPPDTSSMTSDIDFYLADGFITNQGIANSLKSKLAGVEGALNRDDTNAAIGILGAFINEIEAQRDKHICYTAANDLIFHARYLLEHLGD